ncbi:MAG: cysteine desulfurase [Ruminococcaceae bacterium]|nr:cysteine desulfurase [Oscillospiraceae bacterium]
MDIYFDNSATTVAYPEVAKTVSEAMLELYANPSSLHRMGKVAEDAISDARKYISSTVNGTPDEIYFTSGGTESDNLAIIGYAKANKRSGNRIITQKTEHAAVLESFSHLESEGFDVVYIDVDSSGSPDMEMLKNSIDENTILLSFMHVNNENGAIFPIEEISSLCDHKKCMLHVDAVQSFGKIPINVKKTGIDMLSVSSHKIHGPNGVGALYVRKGVKINPIAVGGKQERGLRSGTENVAGILGFSKACEIKFKNMEKDAETIGNIKKALCDGLLENIENVIINSPKDSIHSILNVSFPGVKSEVLLHILESKGIYVSTGSACNSKKNKYSYVLKEMKLKNDVIDSAVRFSFSAFNTMDDVEYTVNVLKKEIPLLRKIMK